MYKVFFNKNVICIGSKAENKDQLKEISHSYFKERILTTIVAFLKDENQKTFIVTTNTENTWALFCSQFTIIEAAGGLVKNEFDETLCIYRLDKWDLPKGKLEGNEKIEDCAIREVEEECGIANLKITSQVFYTYHTYVINFKPILKRTHWFAMETQKQNPTPQTEEDITEVLWADKKKMEAIKQNTYPNIKLVLEHYKLLKL